MQHDTQIVLILRISLIEGYLWWINKLVRSYSVNSYNLIFEVMAIVIVTCLLFSSLLPLHCQCDLLLSFSTSRLLCAPVCSILPQTIVLTGLKPSYHASSHACDVGRMQLADLDFKNPSLLLLRNQMHPCSCKLLEWKVFPSEEDFREIRSLGLGNLSLSDKKSMLVFAQATLRCFSFK